MDLDMSLVLLAKAEATRFHFIFNEIACQGLVTVFETVKIHMEIDVANKP
jgi:hypothetical protein